MLASAEALGEKYRYDFRHAHNVARLCVRLFDEMRAFQRSQPGTSPDKIFELVTVNPALALRQENALGRIRVGFHADLIAIPCACPATVFEQIVAFEKPVDWMIARA